MAERTRASGSGRIEVDDASALNAPSGDAADAPPDLRTALRNATTELHRDLDHAPEQRALLAAAITLGDYATIMTKHRHALASAEATIASLDHARASDLPPYRPRLPALEADLASLGASGLSATEAGAHDMPAVEAEAAMDASVARGRYLGTRYVLEGSTLGAAAIARRLERHLPELRASAFAYWRVQAEEAPAWQAFALTLASLPSHGPLASAAIAAAGDTFGAFLRAFGLEAPHPDHPIPADPEPAGARR